MRLVAVFALVCACGTSKDDRAPAKQAEQEAAKIETMLGSSEDPDARLERVEREIVDAKVAVANAKDERERQIARMKLTNLIAERKIIEMQVYAVRPAPPPTPERVQELREELVVVEAKIKETEQRLAEAKTDEEREHANQMLEAFRSSKAAKLRDIERGMNAK